MTHSIAWHTRMTALAVCALLANAAAAPAAEVSPELIAKAKQEGQVVYYTDLIVDQIVRPLTAAFEAKYGIKVRFVRGDSQVNSLKLLNEYKAGRVHGRRVRAHLGHGRADRRPARCGNSPPPTATSCRRSIAIPDRYWVSSHLFVLEPGLNTSLVPAAQRPKTYDDLLAPYWKDKMVWKPNDLSGATGFVGNILTFMGEERGMDYLRKLVETEHQDGQRQRARRPRSGDRGRIFRWRCRSSITTPRSAPRRARRSTGCGSARRRSRPVLSACTTGARIRMPDFCASNSWLRRKASRSSRRRITCRRAPTCRR